MPYIKKENRSKLKAAALQLGNSAESAGDLNYIITEFLKKNGISMKILMN